LREIEKNREATYDFDTVVNDINALLPLAKLIRDRGSFQILKKTDGRMLQIDEISSGESEAIALAIEALVFSRESQVRERRLLLIDEPDVHLHPDLQARLIRFLEQLAKDNNFKIVVATHSTAMVGSIEQKDDVQVAFMPLTDNGEIKFSPIDEIMKAVLP